MNTKAGYVLEHAAHDGRHRCHWPGCGKAVPPAMWGCKDHWYTIPKPLRTRIWRHFQPGQEITKDPTPEYIAAARAVQDWIQDHLRQQPQQAGLL